MEIGAKIASLRKQRGWSQRRLAQELGVTGVAVGNWESANRTPQIEYLPQLAKIFGVTPNELLGFDAPTTGAIPDGYYLLSVPEKNMIDDYRTLDRFGKSAVRAVLSVERRRVASSADNTDEKVIPFPSETQERYIRRYITPAAAGYSAPIDGEDYEVILCDEDVPAEADYAVRIQGNSMLPYIADGDTVYVKRVEELERGDVGIFAVDGAMYCKILYRDELGDIALVSANPEFKDSNVILSSEGSSTLRIYGKVLLDKKVRIPEYFYDSL